MRFKNLKQAIGIGTICLFSLMTVTMVNADQAPAKSIHCPKDQEPSKKHPSKCICKPHATHCQLEKVDKVPPQEGKTIDQNIGEMVA